MSRCGNGNRSVRILDKARAPADEDRDGYELVKKEHEPRTRRDGVCGESQHTYRREGVKENEENS